MKEFKEKLSHDVKVDNIIFFGSRTIGKARKDSDMDLIVVSNMFKERKCAIAKGLNKCWKVDFPIDFICYTTEEFEEKKKEIFIS
ncbi:MAG: nucleotidyltransferase domain-containing protein [Candidatus Altarchaeum sp.]|nr:nucleotidyltransferase domain-containing protein [Candidatus Altarchaeum sp.]